MHSKYDLPITPGTLPTGQPSQACGSESDGIWMEYNGMCYLFADQMEVDSYEAAEVCIKICFTSYLSFFLKE